MRGGLASYHGTTTREIDPRLSIGACYHFMETESYRWEAGVELTPDTGNFGDNNYTVVSGHFVGFLGEDGSFYWKAGGGMIYETSGSRTQGFGVMEAGGGLYLAIAQAYHLFAGLSMQFPVGTDINAQSILLVNAGLDF